MILTQSPPKTLSTLGRLAVAVLLVAVVIVPVRGQGTEKRAPAPAAAGGPASDIAPGANLQDAIDKSPDGAVIRLAAGVYPEPIMITRPLTLIGAGWQQTTIGSEKPRALSQARKEEFLRKLDATTNPQERARIAMELAAVSQPPSIAVKGASGVTIRGVRVVGPPTGNPDGFTNETLVHFDAATAGVVSECAVVGPSSNGVTVVNGSDVRIEKSLIAAIWNTGVRVYAGERGSGGKPARVHLVDSDVRNCYHRCVTITGEGSVIERNRISGSAWHGIRYDHCSPTVTGNQIFGNARFGIYASGKTAATVTGNVLSRNEMAGMWCLFNNADTVEGNTIAGNLREGIAVSGPSTTILRKNIIAKNPVGLLLSRLSDTGEAIPKLQTKSNVFWDNGQALVLLNEPQPPPEGSESVDPEFVAPEQGDFTLAPDSPARKLGAGAADPIPLASPFPIQPGELAIIPDGETRDYAKWKQPAAEAQPAAAQEAPATQPQPPSTAATEQQRERQRAFAKSRMRQDNRRFPKEDVAAAEELYQVANKNWRSDEARVSLKTMIEKYPELNRTGCAVLYLGQWSQGEERERYLKRAVEKHSDCFYGNGVQVGGFARYLLGHYYREQGKTAEADQLFDEIRKNYPEAITHRGDLLVAVLREEAKGRKPDTATQPAE